MLYLLMKESKARGEGWAATHHEAALEAKWGAHFNRDGVGLRHLPHGSNKSNPNKQLKSPPMANVEGTRGRTRARVRCYGVASTHYLH
jgi:hypothetical protein